jgi:hypothetical protein
MKVDIQFVTHIQAGMPEQDVFVENGGGSQVVRPAADESKKVSQPVYASATAVREDPFQVGSNPLGPFTKGRGLGMTLQQWLTATGSGVYTINGDTAELDLSFQNLVPNGVYTLLSPRITFPPSFRVEPGIPGGDIVKATIRADAKGDAAIHLKIKPLPESTKETATALILVYDSDGEWRGEFGKNAHKQIFFMLPAPAGL